MTKALEALRFVKQAFLNDERWDYTDVGEMVNEAIAEAEKQDGNCQQCGGKGCVACDARKQKPVAWWNDTETHIDLNVSGRGKPLYTHPQPKREWVGLTDEEINNALPGHRVIDALDIYYRIEAKLKEKNNG